MLKFVVKMVSYRHIITRGGIGKMAYANSTTGWSSEKSSQLKNLILRHVSHGGSVLDACEQFEYETGGLHKKRANYWRWTLFIKRTCKEEFYRARQTGLKSRIYKLNEQITSKPMNEGLKAYSDGENTSSERLINSVIEMIEDRKNVEHRYEEQTVHLGEANQSIHSLEDEIHQLELHYAEKEQELYESVQTLQDSMRKYQQLSESYELLKSSSTREYQNMQGQVTQMKQEYERMGSQLEELRTTNGKQIQRLETQLWESLVKNKELTAEINRLNEEKGVLVRSITDFASQMTSMLPGQTESEIQAQVAVTTVNKTVSLAEKNEAANQ